MLCNFPDHECRCSRDDKSCELYTSSLDMYVNDKPTLTEIIDTAFDAPPDPYPVTCPLDTTVRELKNEIATGEKKLSDVEGLEKVGYTPIKRVAKQKS